MEIEGIIIKGIGGFYYVDTKNGIYECRARGKFRKGEISPVVGDNVKISIIDDNKKKGSLDLIYERKNCLLRPIVSNVENMIIVASSTAPEFDFFFVDKLCVLCELYNINPVIVINKNDLADGKKYGIVYENIGYNVFYTSVNEKKGISELFETVKSGINVFGGFSGVGKSTLINQLFGADTSKTGELSGIERGRHTTRHSQLFKINENTYIADTPGFSSLEINFKIDNLTDCFKEFGNYSCRFASCSHIKEKGCAISEAVNNGKIAKSRYESYTSIYNKIKDIKDWRKK